MKAIRLILILAVVLMGAVNAQAEKKGEKTITFNANLHCNSCKAKVEKNIPFEKGVKEFNLRSQLLIIYILNFRKFRSYRSVQLKLPKRRR